jgi:hypothetical protein
MAQEIVVSIQPTERTVEPRLAESSELLNRMNLSRKCSPAERLRSLKAAEDSTAAISTTGCAPRKSCFTPLTWTSQTWGKALKKTSRRPAIASEAYFSNSTRSIQLRPIDISDVEVETST